MQRREFMTSAVVAGVTPPMAGAAGVSPLVHTGADDRKYMLDLLARIATPVLESMSAGRLQNVFKPELSPAWDGRDPQVAYLECFGRLMSGIAPWLALADDDSAEGRLRAGLRRQALASYAHSVDPASPDYLLWREAAQPLVDSAYFTNALLRAPRQLWDPLDASTRRRIVDEIKGLRRVSPPYTNWLLFAAMNEAFLLSVGEQWDPVRIDIAIRKFNEWYVGDGWYSDGPHFHFDHYGSYVIHSMLVEILEVAR